MPGCPDGVHVPSRHLGFVAVLDQDVGLDGPHERAYRHGCGFELGPLVVGHAEQGQLGPHPLDEGVGFHVAKVDQRGVCGVQADPGTRGLTDPSRQTVMIRVDVGDQHPLHVGHGEAGPIQAGHQRVVGLVGVPPGVDDVGPTVGFHGVDQDVAQRVARYRHRDAPQTGADLLHGRKGLG